MHTSFYIEAQKRSRVTKLGAQTQHRVVLRLVPPSASKQSEIMCARDKCGVFHHIGKAISGSTVQEYFLSVWEMVTWYFLRMIFGPGISSLLYSLQDRSKGKNVLVSASQQR